MTLEGTNTYLVGRDPVTVIDPGPEDAGHIEAVRAAAEARGGIGTVLVTHSHLDHIGGVELLGVEPARPADGEEVAGLTALATPGHTEDHLCFLSRASTLCSAATLILGAGLDDRAAGVRGRVAGASTWPRCERVQELDLERHVPGPRSRDRGPGGQDRRVRRAPPSARHGRLASARARRALARGPAAARSGTTCPSQLLPAAAFAMQAHLEKLDAEGRVPRGS